MKPPRSAILLALCSLASFAHAGDIAHIPAEDRVVLSLPLQDTWVPTAEQFSAALVSAQKFLKHPRDIATWQGPVIERILSAPFIYRVQAWGTTQDSRKLIHLNFFPGPGSARAHSFSYWKTEQVGETGGAFLFWYADVDPATNEVVAFQTNQYN